MGTLYVVGAAARDPDDITLRAQRILREVALVVADDVDRAQCLLDHSHISSPLGALADTEAALAALQEGDVALLLDSQSLGGPGPCQRLIRRAIKHRVPVTSIPGPSLPITALILSGLPAEAFVYLGFLPQETFARRALLTSVLGERRTLVALGSPDHLPDALPDLFDVLGDRPLVVMGTDGSVWRGTVSQAQDWLLQGCCALVLGGTREQTAGWNDERLRTEIRTCLGQNLSVKEISRQLAAESGWPRREIYRLAVEIAHSDTDPGRQN